MHTCAQLLLLLHLLHFQPPIKADFGAIGTSGLGWLAEELIHDDDVDDDVTSSYVDDAIYDFDDGYASPLELEDVQEPSPLMELEDVQVVAGEELGDVLGRSSRSR